jgi:uncharacterized protein (TIGR03067 family)
MEVAAMKRSLWLLAGVAILLVAADAKDDEKKEYERFTGTWLFESIEIGGEKVPLDAFKGASLIIDGNKFTAKEPDGKTVHGTYKVDVSKKPKTVDITFSDGPEKGKTIQGIYELDDDTYKPCFDISGKERPTKFETKKGTMLVLETLKREKK